MKMNQHYNELKASYLFVDINHRVAAFQKAHPDRDVIRLGIGDVTRPLAKSVVKAMQDAVAEMGSASGFHGYGPEQGYDFLREAVQGYYAGRGVKLEADEIFISDGAKSDLANILGLFSEDNTVLVPDPVYPTYVDDNVTDGRRIVYASTSEAGGFLAMPDPAVKADIIYICSPNNPTGAAYSREQLKIWVDYAKVNNAVILYDAAYECFVSEEGLARSIFEVEGARDCAIEICSFSKIAGFTGTRCGYTVVPHQLEREGMNLNKLWLRRQTTKFNGLYPRGDGRDPGQPRLLPQKRQGHCRRPERVRRLVLRRPQQSLYLAALPRQYGQLDLLRLAAGKRRRGGHAGGGLRPLRRGLLPPDRLRRRRKDPGGRRADPGRHPVPEQVRGRP